MLPLHDKSDPEIIRERLGMSKKLFKNGVGILYRERRIVLGEDGIYLAENPGAGAGPVPEPAGPRK
jgi:predicted RNA-binding protein (virulence factor B family)